MAKLTLAQIHEQASLAANKAAKAYFDKELGGKDRFPCGFAWVKIEKNVRETSKMGKELLALGFDKGWDSKRFELWNPSNFFVQNVDTLEVGAMAYAQVLRDNGIEAYAQSRDD